jgi:hypothetical protein
MGLEAGTYVDDLVATNPVGASDPKSQGDDHIRLIKAVLKNTFPNLTGAMTATEAELNTLDGITATLAELNALAGIAAFMDTFLGAASEAAARTTLDVFEDVFTTRGDLLRAGVAGAEERLALGADGQFLKSDGTDALWAELPVVGLSSADFTSAELTYQRIQQNLVIAHGLGVVPSLVVVRLRCKVGDTNFSAGVEVDTSTWNDGQGDGISQGISVLIDSTNIELVTGNDIQQVISPTTHNRANLTEDDWKWVVRAWI